MTAGMAAKVRPEQVTVTDPAANALDTTKMILSLLNDEVDRTFGFVMAHWLSF